MSNQWPEESGAASAGNRVLIVGSGNPLRGNDAIGHVVARALASPDAIDGVPPAPELAESSDHCLEGR